MKTYSIRELRNNLSQALKELPVFISSRGKVVAVIRETEVVEEKVEISSAPKTDDYGVEPVTGVYCQEILLNGKPCKRLATVTLDKKLVCPICFNRIKARA